MRSATRARRTFDTATGPMRLPVPVLFATESCDDAGVRWDVMVFLTRRLCRLASRFSRRSLRKPTGHETSNNPED